LFAGATLLGLLIQNKICRVAQSILYPLSEKK